MKSAICLYLDISFLSLVKFIENRYKFRGWGEIPLVVTLIVLISSAALIYGLVLSEVISHHVVFTTFSFFRNLWTS